MILTVIAALGVIGLAQTARATPDESQRLRGLGGRVFLVEVFIVIGGNQFPFSDNCYVFEDGGNWYETRFPTAGQWVQDSTGARTTYRVEGTGPSEGFLQIGLITPAGGAGVLQLSATSTSPLVPPFISFFSVGAEIDASEVASLCPTTGYGATIPLA